MITRKADRTSSRSDHFKGGEGYILNTVIRPADGLNGKGRLFNHGRLEKNCEIGWHVHDGDSEVYYILSGEGEYCDNGTLETVRPGDVCWCDDGEGHSMINRSDEPLEYIALILYK